MRATGDRRLDSLPITIQGDRTYQRTGIRAALVRLSGRFQGGILNLLQSTGAVLGAAVAFCLCQSLAAAASDPPPAWAFPLNPPGKASPDPIPPGTVEHVAGSTAAFTHGQIADEFFVADWFPGEHGPMPPIVAEGRKPKILPCAECHLPTGNGGPAEAALPGLPVSYIVEQFNEFRSGRRTVAQHKMQSARGMEAEAKAVNDSDIATAAAYFSQLSFTSHFHVVETGTVPKTRVGEVSLNVKIPDGGSEPIGARIVEVPDDAKQWEVGNVHTEFTAYVPKGSIARGETLVAASDGPAAACRACHGADLKGSGDVPPLAGRSPSYLARQLYDIQYGTRAGPTVAPMLPEVAHLTAADRIAIVAYLGSLTP